VAILAGILFGIYVIVEIVLAGGGAPPAPPSSISMNLRGGHVVTNRISTKSWTFDYDRARLSPDGMTGTVDGVRDGVVYRKGKPYLKISAQHVQLDIESLDFTAIGKVHVERIGYPVRQSFDTDMVTWTNNAQLLRMTHPVFMHTGSQVLRIDGVTVDFDANTVRFGKIAGGVQVRH
jgi:hypothetical protein